MAGRLREYTIKEVCRVLKDALTRHPLNDLLSRCLSEVADEMYRHKLISKSVRNNPSVHNVIDEFESGMVLFDDITKLWDHCQLFLQCLSNQGGPIEASAQKLGKKWVEEVKNKFDISLDLSYDNRLVTTEQGWYCR